MTRRARVLFHPFLFLPEEWNGLDEHLLMLARYLDRERFELSVLIHPSDGPQTQVLAERASMRGIPAPYATSSGGAGRLRGLLRLYRAERFDILHLHSPVAGGQLVSALAGRLARLRAVVATYHQIQPHRQRPRTRLINWFTHASLVNHVIAVSSDVRATLASAAGLPFGRVEVVLNGIEPADANDTPLNNLPPRSPGEVRLGYFGRLSPEKGVIGLLEALAVLAPRCPQVKTLIVGDGPERAALMAAAERLGLAGRVDFLGFRPDARRIMREVDIMVHAPVYEGFGLVVAEAMAAAKPVVGNDAPGGVKEMVVHGETGLLAPAGSAAALASAIAQLVDAPDVRARMGQQGLRRFNEQLSARGMTQRVQRIYDRLLEPR
jgi:glycosyltransferase involved in cell wall biosynthesis